MQLDCGDGDDDSISHHDKNYDGKFQSQIRLLQRFSCIVLFDPSTC